MYADRYTGQSGRFSPAGLVAAIGINAGVVAALMVAAPYVGITEPERTLETYPVPIEPPPEPMPLPKKAQPSVRPVERIEAVKPIVDSPPTIDRPVAFDPLPFDTGDLGGSIGGTGSGGTTVDPPAAAPVIVGPSVDPRYAGDLQPSYPSAEQRLGRDGRVTVRVLVGTDGRVRQVERVSATSDAFFAATQAQALRRWRFRPGTRDGVAQEAWRTMTVTFRLED